MKTRPISMRFTEAQLDLIDAIHAVKRQEEPWRTWGRAEVVADLLAGVRPIDKQGKAYDRLRAAVERLDPERNP